MKDVEHRKPAGAEERTSNSDDEHEASVTERILEVRVADFDEFFEESSEALRAALDGEAQPAGLAFETPQQLLRLFTDARYELLETIRTERPESIRELARLVERDPSAVHRDLDELGEYGIVEFEEHGRAKRPVLGYDEIRVSVDLTFEANGVDDGTTTEFGAAVDRGPSADGGAADDEEE